MATALDNLVCTYGKDTSMGEKEQKAGVLDAHPCSEQSSHVT